MLIGFDPFVVPQPTLRNEGLCVWPESAVVLDRSDGRGDYGLIYRFSIVLQIPVRHATYPARNLIIRNHRRLRSISGKP